MKLAWSNLFMREAPAPETALGQRSRMMEYDQMLL